MKKSFLNYMFPNPSSNEMINLVNFNNLMLMLMTMLLIMSMSFFVFNKMKTMNFSKWENEKIEFFWTSMPSIILLSMAMPSILILYQLEESNKPLFSTKIMGNQWFWSSEYSSNLNNLSNIMMEKSMKMRCLMTNNPILIPCLTPSKILISSNDVIHSFSVNNLALKSDAIPGRINSLQTEIKKPGVSTGQCSEICGMNHSFMPIMINSFKI